MNEELKKQIETLKAEIDELKKQLVDNKREDERRHKEIKKLKKQQHQDNVRWSKINAMGIFSTPFTAILGLITWWINKKKEDKNN